MTALVVALAVAAAGVVSALVVGFRQRVFVNQHS